MSPPSLVVDAFVDVDDFTVLLVFVMTYFKPLRLWLQDIQRKHSEEAQVWPLTVIALLVMGHINYPSSAGRALLLSGPHCLSHRRIRNYVQET